MPPSSNDPRDQRRNGGGEIDGDVVGTVTAQLDVHDPYPPADAVMAAEDVIKPVMDKDGSGALRWRRKPAVSPVVRVEDKFIVGPLDLRALEFPYLLEFVRCRFQEPPDLRQGNLAGISFNGCWLPGLLGRNARIDNDIVLIDTTVQGRAVDLTDAHIKGSLMLYRSRLNNPGGRGLRADRLELAGALLANNLEVVGEARLPGLRAGGNVDLRGAGMHNPAGGYALDGNGLHIGGNLLCGIDPVSGNKFTSTGCLYLPSAHVESDLSLRGAELRPCAEPPSSHIASQLDDPDSYTHTTLHADRITVNGNFELDQGFRSVGMLHMVNGRIGGSLRLTGAEIDVQAGPMVAPRDNYALYFDGTDVQGDLDAGGVRITGQAHLLDVAVRGSVRLDGAYLAHPDEDVLVARRLQVGSNVECRDADIYGSMIMQGSRIGANLDLRSSHITRPGRYTRDRNIKPCLDIRATTIGRDLICAAGQRPFTSAGEIRMHRAEIGREINFNGAVLGTDERSTALNAFGAQTQELVLTVRRPPEGKVSLSHVRCASLRDNEKIWSATGALDLEDFRYDSLSPAIDLEDDATVERRLRWLRSAMTGEYIPGPYDQFATMLRASGNEEHADTVLMAKQRHRYAALAKGFRVLGPPVHVWSFLQRWMVGYGYRPVRALGWLLILLIVGTLWFWLYPQHCHPVGGDPSDFAAYPLCPLTNQDDHLVWNPFLFTLDLLVPIVDFGNKNRWSIPGYSMWLAATLEASGWILATTVAAGLANLLRRN